MNNFFTRTLTGSIFVATLVVSVLLNKYSFYTFFALCLVLGLFEFYHLFKNTEYKVNKYLGIITGIIIYVIQIGIIENLLPFEGFLLLFLCIGLILVAELYRKHEKPFQNVALTLLGILYVAVPFTLLLATYKLFDNKEIQGKIVVLSIFILIWANDTFAYLVGISIGKNKLFERISPKKSWEGFIGGIICSVGIAYILSILIAGFPLWVWVILSFLISTIGTIGDLLESLLKRSLQIKDSGCILPGHGGILDRFDSMLFVTPFVYLMFQIIYYFNLLS